MTTKVLAELKRLNEEENLCDAEIARRLGIRSSVVWKWRNELGLPLGKSGKQCKKHYAFYDRKTTQFLCEGTLEECANILGLAMSGMHSILTRVRKGENKKYEIHEVEE